MELYSRSEAAAMLGITVRKLDELRARRLIGYYQRCPGKYSFLWLTWKSICNASRSHQDQLPSQDEELRIQVLLERRDSHID